MTRMDFQKYLFAYTQEYEKEPSYEFVPYKYGCFSFQSYADKRRLIEVGALTDSDDWSIKKGFKYSSAKNEQEKFGDFYTKYSDLKGKDLVRDIYKRYPYYATKSEIADTILTAKELAAVKAMVSKKVQPTFFTIGYEGSSFEGYLNRLIKNDVRVLVDVRRNPLSRKYGFSKKTLSETVQKLGIEYVHIPELGISSERRHDLNTQADYDRLFASYEKSELKNNNDALKKLYKIFLDKKRVAITCFEAHVCMCHRGRVAKALSQMPDWDYPIDHI